MIGCPGRCRRRPVGRPVTGRASAAAAGAPTVTLAIMMTISVSAAAAAAGPAAAGTVAGSGGQWAARFKLET